MNKILYLSQADVVSLALSMERIVQELCDMFLLKGQGKVEMPPKPGIHTRPDAFIHAMPASIPDMNAAGIKWVSGYPENYKKNLPYISGLMIMNDPETGMPLAVMDCVWLTAKRTGAATAVAAKYLARLDSESIGILGCGVQGNSNLEALMVVQSEIKTVYCYDLLEQKTQEFISANSAIYPDIKFVCARSPKQASEQSDIIVTSGPILKNPDQIIEPEWFKQGAFASPVDFDSYWKPQATSLCDKYCTDDRQQHAYYKKSGYFRQSPDIYADLGEIVAGIKPGRENAKERIISANLGLALDDIAIGKIMLEMAREQNIGVELEL